MNKKAVKRVLGLPKSLWATKIIYSLPDGDYLIKNVPYQCQFASSEKAGDILEGRLDAKDDPHWAIPGFKTKEESSYWAWRDCGICCIKMVLDFYGNNDSVAKLVKKGLELKGYDTKKDFGWFYQPLVNLVKEYGISGHTASSLSKQELAKHILKNRFVVASVNPSIIRLDKEIKSKEKSGHLVLVTGFQIMDKQISGFYINNPSGKIPETQQNAFIPTEIFNNAFGEQGIVLEKK